MPIPKPVEIDFSEFLEPKIYLIKHQVNENFSVGESNNVLKRIGFHFNKLSFKDTKIYSHIFKEDWEKSSLNDFEFIALALGSKWLNLSK